MSDSGNAKVDLHGPARGYTRPAVWGDLDQWPSDNEAERGVLGCVVNDPSLLDAVLARLGGNIDAFRDMRHQEVFKAIQRAYPLPREDAAMLTIQTAHELEGATGFDGMPSGERRVFVSRLFTENLGYLHELEYYLGRLTEAWTRRRILQTCFETAAEAIDTGADLSDILDRFERGALAVRLKSTQNHSSIKEIVKQAINDIEDYHQNKGGINGVSTGFTDWDKLTGGLQPGEVTVIAAYPATGKTALAMNVAEHVALDQKLPIGVFSLEMSAKSLVLRMLCSRARVNLRNVREGFLMERDFPKLTAAAGKIANSLIQIHDISDLTVEEFRAEARRMVQSHGVKLIVVDYLQLLTASGGKRKIDSRQEEVSAISGGIKKSAAELSIPIIALSQLNDEGKLRESRAIGQDADNIAYLIKDTTPDGEEESPDTVGVTLDVRKQRNGPTGKAHLVFLKAYTRFEAAAKIHNEDLPGYKQPHND